jgi:geranylgeranylglycerol-phosphate geranylgeranyltransferase
MGLRAYVGITRPPNSLLMYVAVMIGVLFSSSKTISPLMAILAFITAYGLNGASMVINDYFDKESDAVNKPTRPIPSGLITPTNAIRYSIGLAAAGIISAALTSIPCLAVASTAYFISFLYNWRMKKTGLLGNSLVSIDVVAPFIYGSVLADGFVTPRVLVFAILAFIANNGREVIKGISDVDADAVRGVSTVARRYGAGAAALVGSFHYWVAVALSPLPYMLGYVNIFYLPAVAIADMGFIYTSYSILKEPSGTNSEKQKKLSLLWMFIALLSFIVGGLDLG